MEAAPGLEPGNEGFAGLCLTNLAMPPRINDGILLARRCQRAGRIGASSSVNRLGCRCRIPIHEYATLKIISSVLVLSILGGPLAVFVQLVEGFVLSSVLLRATKPNPHDTPA